MGWGGGGGGAGRGGRAGRGGVGSSSRDRAVDAASNRQPDSGDHW